jgi:hypothetical protein
MRKIDLLARNKEIDDSILALSNSGRKMHPEMLTCKDLKRLNKAFDTVYELFDKCMVEEKR